MNKDSQDCNYLQVKVTVPFGAFIDCTWFANSIDGLSEHAMVLGDTNSTMKCTLFVSVERLSEPPANAIAIHETDWFRVALFYHNDIVTAALLHGRYLADDI